MTILRSMFSRKWILTTILVIAACGVMARLGIWQLDRLETRRAFNARVYAQQDRDPLVLNEGTVNEDLFNMEYREVLVTGVYLKNDEVVLRNRVYEGIPGYRVFTPLQISGTDHYVMIDRGFVPTDLYGPDWEKGPETGEIEILGIIRRQQSEPDFGGRADPTPLPGEKLTTWNIANLEQMAKQLDYDLLPVYIQDKPPEGTTSGEQKYPAAYVNELELTEGSHLGYAFQWFLFASILGLGYPFFIRRESMQSKGEK